MAIRMKVLLLGGAAVAAGAVAYFKRDRVAGLLPSHGETPAAAPPPPPAPSNYDVAGPVANTATPVPAPEPQVQPAGLDEEAEADAAAAEAANIGGGPTEYAGPAGERATEAWRPLAEAGQGEAEGQEQTEAELTENAILRDAGMTGAQEQLEEAIEQQRNPLAGETAEPLVSEEPAEPPAPTPPPSEPPAPVTDQPTVPDQRAPAGPDQPSPAADQPAPAADQPAPDQPAPSTQESAADDEDTGWKTWSGRSVGS